MTLDDLESVGSIWMTVFTWPTENRM